MSKPEQTIEIVVSGDLTFPGMTSTALSGRTVTLVLSDVVVQGYSAQMGGGQQGVRPSQRSQDHLRIRLTAGGAVLELAPEPVIEVPAIVAPGVEEPVVDSAPEVTPEEPTEEPA